MQDDLDAQLAMEGTFGQDEALDNLFVAMQRNVNHQVDSHHDLHIQDVVLGIHLQCHNEAKQKTPEQSTRAVYGFVPI